MVVWKADYILLKVTFTVLHKIPLIVYFEYP
jgi:hypothetical protein